MHHNPDTIHRKAQQRYENQFNDAQKSRQRVQASVALLALQDYRRPKEYSRVLQQAKKITGKKLANLLLQRPQIYARVLLCQSDGRFQSKDAEQLGFFAKRLAHYLARIDRQRRTQLLQLIEQHNTAIYLRSQMRQMIHKERRWRMIAPCLIGALSAGLSMLFLGFAILPLTLALVLSVAVTCGIQKIGFYPRTKPLRLVVALLALVILALGVISGLLGFNITLLTFFPLLHLYFAVANVLPLLIASVLLALIATVFPVALRALEDLPKYWDVALFGIAMGILSVTFFHFLPMAALAAVFSASSFLLTLKKVGCYPTSISGRVAICLAAASLAVLGILIMIMPTFTTFSPLVFWCQQAASKLGHMGPPLLSSAMGVLFAGLTCVIRGAEWVKHLMAGPIKSYFVPQVVEHQFELNEKIEHLAKWRDQSDDERPSKPSSDHGSGCYSEDVISCARSGYEHQRQATGSLSEPYDYVRHEIKPFESLFESPNAMKNFSLTQADEADETQLPLSVLPASLSDSEFSDHLFSKFISI